MEGFWAKNPSSPGPYKRWYDEAYTRWRKAHPLGGIFLRRHRVHVVKLAVIYAVSMSGTLQVELEAWDRAVAKAREMEEMMFELFRTDMSKAGYILSKMEEAVLAAGPRGLKMSAFTLMFRNDRDLERHRKSLLDSETMFRWSSKTGGLGKGRPAEYFIHAKFWDRDNGCPADPPRQE